MLGLLLRVVLSLAVVLGILWLVAKGGRRGGRTRLVRVAGRQALSRTASLAVVEVADRVLVLGVSDAGVRLLTELDPEQIAEPEDAEAATPGPAVAGGSAFAGSVLSPVTWKQAWAAATRTSVVSSPSRRSLRSLLRNQPSLRSLLDHQGQVSVDE